MPEGICQQQFSNIIKLIDDDRIGEAIASMSLYLQWTEWKEIFEELYLFINRLVSRAQYLEVVLGKHLDNRYYEIPYKLYVFFIKNNQEYNLQKEQIIECGCGVIKCLEGLHGYYDAHKICQNVLPSELFSEDDTARMLIYYRCLDKLHSVAESFNDTKLQVDFYAITARRLCADGQFDEARQWLTAVREKLPNDLLLTITLAEALVGNRIKVGYHQAAVLLGNYHRDDLDYPNEKVLHLMRIKVCIIYGISIADSDIEKARRYINTAHKALQDLSNPPQNLEKHCEKALTLLSRTSNSVILSGVNVNKNDINNLGVASGRINKQKNSLECRA